MNSRLIKRLNEDAEFPHEIGLFPGYPPEDVRGFIENRAERSVQRRCSSMSRSASGAVRVPPM